MSSPAAPLSRSLAARASGLLFAPAAVSIGFGAAVAGSNYFAGETPDAAWTLLILLGPSIPLYLLMLPLFPFALRALRRGWDPKPLRVVAAALGASVVFDLAYWWGHA